jgi:hypothetical protein
VCLGGVGERGGGFGDDSRRRRREEGRAEANMRLIRVEECYLNSFLDLTIFSLIQHFYDIR